MFFNQSMQMKTMQEQEERANSTQKGSSWQVVLNREASCCEVISMNKFSSAINIHLFRESVSPS